MSLSSIWCRYDELAFYAKKVGMLMRLTYPVVFVTVYASWIVGLLLSTNIFVSSLIFPAFSQFGAHVTVGVSVLFCICPGLMITVWCSLITPLRRSLLPWMIHLSLSLCGIYWGATIRTQWCESKPDSNSCSLTKTHSSVYSSRNLT